MTLVDSLTSFTCKRFARHVATEILPLEGGVYAKVKFWIHWLICPFCSRYWKEMKAIGDLSRLPLMDTTDVKARLKKNLMQGA